MKKILFLFFGLLAGCAAVTEPDYTYKTENALIDMNMAYQEKDADAFMAMISPEYAGNLEELRLAVENDFAGFVSVDYNVSVLNTVYHETTGRYTAAVFYSRSAKSPRYGVANRSGEAFLEFETDENGLFKLVKMSEPPLYGLIAP